VRAVTGLEARLKEAAALGFASAVVPQGSLADRGGHPLDVHGVGSVDEAVKVLLGP
jgi:predicted ATP-dependent serine protease